MTDDTNTFKLAYGLEMPQEWGARNNEVLFAQYNK